VQIFLLILSFLAGFLIKFSDDIEDKNIIRLQILAVPSGIAYGLVMGYSMVKYHDASIIFGGIILGCLFTGKINSMGHYFGLGTILTILFLNGIIISPIFLAIAVLAALDELEDVLHIPQFLNAVFKYRLILKSGTLILVILKLLGIEALLILIAFDTAYILAHKIDSRFSHEI